MHCCCFNVIWCVKLKQKVFPIIQLLLLLNIVLTISILICQEPLLIGRFQKISIPKPRTASRISEGEGGFFELEF